MPRRTKNDDLFAEVIEGLAGLILLGSLFLSMKFENSFNAFLWLLFGGIFLLFSVALGIRYLQKYLQKKRLLANGINDVDRMGGVTFEKFLREFYKKAGYRVSMTPGSADYGCDLIFEKAGKRIVVQAKRYSNNVGIKAVHEIIGAIAHYKATEGWVITSSYFTENARKLARSNSIGLVDRDDLIKMLLKRKAAIETKRECRKRDHASSSTKSLSRKSHLP